MLYFSADLPEAAVPPFPAIGCNGPFFLSSDRFFFLSTWWAMLKRIAGLFNVVSCVKGYAFPLMEIKCRMWKSLFWASFSYCT